MLSRGRLAFVSATAIDVIDDEDVCAGGGDIEVKAGGRSGDDVSLSKCELGEVEAVQRDENGGGLADPAEATDGVSSGSKPKTLSRHWERP